jgi:UDP-3-O-[3-hydroxymyristoyl] glucosamine N-acyltransferase
MTTVATKGTKFGPNVTIHESAVIEENCDIGANVFIGPNVHICRNVVIKPGVVIGTPGFGFKRAEWGGWTDKEHEFGVMIGRGVHVGANTCIDAGSWRATVIDHGARIDNLVHIAHNVVIGERAVIVACAEISGSVEIGPHAWIGPRACILQRVKIGYWALVGMGAVVLKDVLPHTTVAGCPAKVINPNEGVREEM